MRRRAALLLLLIPAAVAWVGAVRGDLELLFLAGTVAVLAGGVALAMPGARVWRVAVVTLSFATVPAAAAVPLGRLAELRPAPSYGGWILSSLPTATTAEVYRVHGYDRFPYKISRNGLSDHRTLRASEEWMRPSGPPLCVLADRDVPWRHVGLLLGLASRAGIRRAWLGVRRPDEEWIPYWLPVSLTRHVQGHTVHIEPVAFRTARLLWGHRKVRYATEASFRFRERETRAVADLGRWFQTDEPGRIEADDGAPYWAVVTVIDQLRLAGIRRFDLGPLPKPTPEEWEAHLLPYPTQR